MTRWIVSAAVLWASSAWAALPPVPAPPVLSGDEFALLADREVVVQFGSADEGPGAVGMGVIDVRAPVGRTMDAVMALEHRAEESSAVRSVVITRHAPPGGGEPETLGARFLLKVMGTEIVFHTAYEVDRASGWAVFQLDPTQDNDIVRADGSYHVFATPTGSRVVYRTLSDSGRQVPEWIRRWLANNSLRGQLEGIRGRAEAS